MSTKNADREWFNALEGTTVTQICVDDAITLRCTDGRRTFGFTLEGAFQFSSTEKNCVEIVPDGDPIAISPVLGLLMKRVDTVVLSTPGQLSIGFAGGQSVTLDAEESFSSWRLAENGRIVMASMPEGYALVRPSDL